MRKFGLLFCLIVVLISGCGLTTTHYPVVDQRYTVIANGSSRQNAIANANKKALQICKKQRGQFVLINQSVQIVNLNSTSPYTNESMGIYLTVANAKPRAVVTMNFGCKLYPLPPRKPLFHHTPKTVKNTKPQRKPGYAHKKEHNHNYASKNNKKKVKNA